MKTWKQIWESRISEPIKADGDELLMELLRADGFDGGGGDSYMTIESWLTYISQIKKELSIQETDSLYEVGCGCGPVLYPFYKAGHKIGGLDYSDNLIQQGKLVMPNAELIAGEASEIDDTPYDFVISNGVFLYFSDFEYATNVIEKMWKKARKGIAILESPDLRTKDILEAKRRQECEGDYDEKFKGLGHLYYPKSWFLEFAEQKEASKIVIAPQNIPNYGYNGVRFNCFILK